MPWKANRLVDTRFELLSRLRDGERASDLAREYGVSRKTIYKFKQRLRTQGVDGLQDASRRPHRIANRLEPEVEEALLALKRKYKSWGAKKVRKRLAVVYPQLRQPAVSTIQSLFLRHGLVVPRKRATKVAGAGTGLRTPSAPNVVWGADFKGQFRMGDRQYCYPLTTSDLFSRYILGCEGFAAIDETLVIEAFWELFGNQGLPDAIRVDNGVPFASRARWGLSSLSVMWMQLGIAVERIQPGCPQDNGCHERMHRTLKLETARPAGRHLIAQQEKFDQFQKVFNQERPHESLDMGVPADVYTRSSRVRPMLRPALEYPFADDVIVVSPSGHVRLHGRHHFFLAGPLKHQQVGIQEQASGKWILGFADFDLGTYDPSQSTFLPNETLQPSSLRPC